MVQLSDTSAIQRLLRRARVRIRLQGALEGATTATVLAAASAAVSVLLVRTQAVPPTTGIAMLVASGVVIIIGAIIGASRRLDDEQVARRIDRASGLADRLSTSIAFARDLATGKRPAGETDDDVTEDMMRAAIRDGIRAAPRANLRAATPFSLPRDLRAAIGFLAISALAAGLALPAKDHDPVVYRAVPDHAPPGAEVTIIGASLTRGVVRPLNAGVMLGTPAMSRAVTIIDWLPNEIQVQLPADAPLGDQKLMVYAGNERIGMVDMTVVDPRDPRYHKQDSVALDPDERAYIESLIAELRNAAQRDKVPELEDFANKVEQLLKKAENGELSKQDLLDAMQKAEDALQKNAEPKQDEVDKKLADMGKELAKDPLTKELGDALQKQDLEKAQQELEKIADKLDNKELDQKQKDELAKKLDEVTKQMEKQEQQEQKQQENKQQQLQKQIDQLQKQMQNAKSEQEKQQLQPRLEEKQRELQKLQRDQEQKQQSEQRRALQRLQKDMEKAAENLEQKPSKDGSQQDKDQQEQQNDKQASRNLHDAARETGKVDQDKRKQATQKKMSSQMDELREAMRRAKQQNNKGPQDPFNRQGKNQDFAQRARGGHGQGQGWKPGQNGQGQGQGQGQQNGQNGGQGSGNGGNDWGVGHDDNLTGDPTQTSGNDKDQDLQGQSSNEGGSTRETILAAAQKGFSGVGYKNVYVKYTNAIEEVMRAEKLPSSYKYYVKRYFAKIHPNMVEAPK
jgi:hypothetical protein